MPLATTKNITNDGLVAYYDAGIQGSYSGSGSALTDLAKSYDSTLQLGTGYSNVNGGTFTFDGIEDYIDVPSAIGAIGNLGTIDLWFKHPGGGAGEMLIGWGDGTGSNRGGLSIGERNSGINGEYLEYGNLSDGVFSLVINLRDTGGNENFLKDNAWHHVGVIVDGSNNRLFVDGTFPTTRFSAGSATANAFINTANTTAIHIGKRPFNAFPNSIWFEGNIATLRIYSRGLSDDEIKQNFEAERNRFGV